MLPSTIRAIIWGPSNCSKTFSYLFESPNGVSRTCTSTRNRCNSQSIDISKIYLHLDKISYFTFSNNSDVVPPSEARSNSIFIFDDVHATNRIQWENTFRWLATRMSIVSISVRRIREYLTSDTRQRESDPVPSCSNRTNLKHVYNDHVNTDMYVYKIRTMNFVRCAAKIVGNKNMDF